MPRLKRNSKVLDKAEVRVAGMQSISDTLTLENGLSVEQFNAMIAEMRAKLTTYNTALSAIDKARSEVLELEQKLGDYSERMLLGVASRYGKSSNEYEMAGGVRKDRRKSRKPSSVSTKVSSVA